MTLLVHFHKDKDERDQLLDEAVAYAARRCPTRPPPTTATPG